MIRYWKYHSVNLFTGYCDGVFIFDEFDLGAVPGSEGQRSRLPRARARRSSDQRGPAPPPERQHNAGTHQGHIRCHHCALATRFWSVLTGFCAITTPDCLVTTLQCQVKILKLHGQNAALHGANWRDVRTFFGFVSSQRRVARSHHGVVTTHCSCVSTQRLSCQGEKWRFACATQQCEETTWPCLHPTRCCTPRKTAEAERIATVFRGAAHRSSEGCR
jgi:hypothetical protein